MRADRVGRQSSIGGTPTSVHHVVWRNCGGSAAKRGPVDSIVDEWPGDALSVLVFDAATSVRRHRQRLVDLLLCIVPTLIFGPLSRQLYFAAFRFF